MSKSRDIADSAATINYIDNVTSDVQSQINTLDTALDNISVTSGTLTKTFTTGESSTINLTSSVLAPVVSVTKEVPQSGVTNNSWDVNSTTENYTRLNSAAATTLDWATSNVSGASFVDSFSIAAQESSPRGLAFNTNGTTMFVLGGSGDDVNEYALSTGFDISTASFVDSFSVVGQSFNPWGLAFNTDGTKMYVTDLSGEDVDEYTLSTGFDVSTASYSQNYSLSAQTATPRGISFNTDGTKMFIVDYASYAVDEYSLSTGFDVSTSSYTQAFSVISQTTGPTDVSFNSTGTKMFVVGLIGDSVYEYALTTGFNVSTASFVTSLNVVSQETSPSSVAFSSDGLKMFVLGYATDSVNEYTLPPSLALGTGSFASADVGKTIEANDGVFVLTATDGSYVETTAPTSYAQVASGSWEMYGVVYNAADGDLELSGYGNAYDLAAASYSSIFLSTGVESPAGSAIKPDGTEFYVVFPSNDTVYHYTLSTPFDISSATLTSTLDVAAQDSTPYGLDIKPDGTKIYIIGNSNDRVFEYGLPTAWSLSGATYNGASDNLSGNAPTPTGVSFKSDGTKFYIASNSNGKIFQYNLSTPWSIATSNFTGDVSLDVSAQDANPVGIFIEGTGTYLFLLANNTQQKVFKYQMSTPWDLSTATYTNISFDLSSQEGSGGPFGICFDNSGTKMYISGDTNNKIYQYDTGEFFVTTGYQPVHTTQSIDSTYWTDINSMTADQAAGSGNVYYAISTDDRTTWTVIDNTDGERDIVRNNAGTWQYNSNGTYASETWVNGATNTELATLAEAMEGAVGLANTFDVSTAVYDSVSLASSDTQPQGVEFNSDGTALYIVGDTNNSIYQYSLSTAYDISSASYVGLFSVASQDSTPRKVRFNNDGTKMYVLGGNNNSVYQYSLSTAYLVSSASYDSVSFSVSSQSASSLGLVFNTSGTKMFVVDITTDSIYQYSLSSSWDLSTASYDSISFSVLSEDSVPTGIAFDTTGTKMFVVGITDDKVFQYSLVSAFDISTASYASISFSVSSTSPTDVVFNSDGSKMYVSDQASDDVRQYSVGTSSYTNQMDKTQLDAVTDPNHIALGDDLDLAIVFNMTSGSTVPSSDGVAINYDATVLNKGAVLGTDYDFDAPAQDKVRITALAGNNLKVRVV